MTDSTSPSRKSRSRSSFAAMFSSSAPLAQSSIARDIANDPYANDSDDGDDDDATFSPSHISRTTSHQRGRGFGLGSSYRRQSIIASGTARASYLPGIIPSGPDASYLTEEEQAAVRDEERSLLRDNDCIPPKHPGRRSSGATSPTSLKRRASSFFQVLKRSGSRRADDDENAIMADPAGNAETHEETPLLVGQQSRVASLPYGGEVDTPEDIDRKWEEAVAAGKIHTTWQREAKVLGRYSRPLLVTFFLQYSLPLCSVFAVGHLGKLELGAVSLATMTANITGYAVYQGLATSLDTLCPQAYGSGHKKLVGLQMQRMVFFLWMIIIPIGAVWLSGERILNAIVPEKETARLAGLYLKIVLVGLPGYAAFESGKRFVQAQGLFTANLYVLMIVAPLNAFMHWLLVWHLRLGFIGAPISVAITETLMPILLFFYVRFVAGSECWGGLSRDAFRNWWPMVRLALPGFVMLLAEFLAFEILTLVSSWISPTHLASQSVLQSMCALVWQTPFSFSVGASTRIANLIGATLAEPAKVAAKVALFVAVAIGVLDMVLLSSLRYYIPRLFTSDEEVIELTAAVLPLCAAFQLFDSLATCCNGILRGIGRQEFGGYVSLICYYGVAMPISFGTCFGLHWDLYGLWAGPALALGLVSVINIIYIYRTDWQRSVDEATKRNTSG